MPYHWTDTPNGPEVLRLTAHRSLSSGGFVLFIGITVVMLSIPLMSLIGTIALWWILPFFAIAVWAVWIAIMRSYKDGEVTEVLCREGDVVTLIHRPVKGEAMSWECNLYWVRPELHAKGGPVAQYVTLSGNGRTAEIGRFLAEEERSALFRDLMAYLAREKGS